MIEKFNGIFYLIVFLVHFLIFAVYAYQTVFATKTFLDKFGIDDTGAGMTRFFGSLFIGAVAMAIWVGFIRPDGLQGTWAFFNLVFFTYSLCYYILLECKKSLTIGLRVLAMSQKAMTFLILMKAIARRILS